MELVERYKDRMGDEKFKGNTFLKASQTYTKGFARAVKKVILKHEIKIRKNKHALKARSRTTSNEMQRDKALWEDAGLQSVLDYLTKDS